MKRLIVLALIPLLLAGCGIPVFPEPTQAPGPAPVPDFIFPDPTQPVAAESDQNPESITDLIHLMDYAILVEALLDAGCEELCWATPDLDGDGLPELTAQTFAGSASAPSQIIADGSSLAMEGFTGTGNSQDVGFYVNEAGITGLFSGYNMLGITDGHFYRWTGSYLQEVIEVPETTPPTDPYGGIPETEPPMVHYYQPLYLYNPELRTLISPLDAQLTANMFHAAYLNRGMDAEYLAADLDSDGNEEYIFLLCGAADSFLSRVSGMSFWGDEAFLNWQDRQISAVVISTSGGQTWIRLARPGIEAMEEVFPVENGLVIDGQTCYYQTTGEPFVAADAASVQSIETDLVHLTLPDSWWNRYLYSCYERPEEDGSRSLMALVFRERTGYLSFGGGHLFSLILLPEDAPIDYPQYEQLGTLTQGEKNYTVLAVYPSDVQYTEENQAAYTAMQADIPAILATLTPAEGASFTPKT